LIFVMETHSVKRELGNEYLKTCCMKFVVSWHSKYVLHWIILKDLMFFWPCIMNWLYIDYQLWCTDYYLFIKYYFPLHVSSLKRSSSGGYSCIHAAYGTVTLYEISWWPVGTQLEWELIVGGRMLVGVFFNKSDTLCSV
jgi:hypothetical protein